MKSHRFSLTVKINGSRLSARLDVLSAFANRKPDGSYFYLHTTPPHKAKKKGRR